MLSRHSPEASAPLSPRGLSVARFLDGGGIWPAVPALVYLLVFMVAPIATLLTFGFVDIDRGTVGEGGFTLSHMVGVLSDPLVWRLTWRSFWIAVVSTSLTLIFAYPVAYAYGHLRGAARTLLLVAVMSPLLTSALVRTYAWIVILGGRRGLVNQTLLTLGLIERPLDILNTSTAVLIGMTQIHLPFMILPLLAVLSERDRSFEQASLNLGASQTVTFFRVTVPMSMPAIVAGFALVFAVSYTNFIVPQLLGGGNYSTIAVQVYEQTIVVLDWSRGAALATLLLSSCFVFVFAIVAAGNWLTRWSEVRR
ncbi:putative spermidine/putrescine transport system permease protein [Angulomicrobium tetraedrale]|uniref:Putative spermidine/putrescine transport system permease protein n=1 Tax=Ancylobacter tetraedralis TaxID=217068 RepID=A0A839Z0W5_9HYPH|nr:ABC transporter permease [Ancylobacter tetraedralis]MBB3770384.1 putative spermidine/putrescine transport system permease protein [Ancylobacter tetraedralis]